MTDTIVKDFLRRTAAAILAAPGDPPAATTCIRLFAGRADGCDGVFVDRLGALVVATDYREPKPTTKAGDEADAARRLLLLVQGVYGDVPIVAKARARQKEAESFVFARSWATGPESPPAPTPILGLERGLRFEIGTDPAHDFGLFLDAAKARLHVRTVARGLHVLNLFSYTGAFGVAAAVGGAASVTNVDPNRDYLAWGLRNAALNQVRFRVLPDTAQDFLRKHARRMARRDLADAPANLSSAPVEFELVIVDPPAFGVGRGRERLMRLLWPELFTALRGMRPEHLVLLCNDKYLRARRSFEEMVQAELGGDYRFTRLGTCLGIDELATERCTLAWRPGRAEDPYYLEPVVLAGQRLVSPARQTGGG